MRVLIIIPAFNEQQSIANVVRELREVCPQYDYIVMNDCSSDDTLKVLEENNIEFIDLPVNLGIGGNVQTGYKYALASGYDIAVQFDGDGQHDPNCLADIIAPIERGEADMCIGSRFIKKEGFQTSAMRRFGIKFLGALLRLTCGSRVSDVTSGFRACSREMFELFAKNYAQDYPEPEAIMAATVSGFRVCEVPVVMRERTAGKSSISPLKSFYFMFKVSLAIVIGRFSYKGRRRNGHKS